MLFRTIALSASESWLNKEPSDVSVESNVSFPTSALPASDNVLKPSRVCLISSIENSPDSMTSPIASKMSKLKNSAFDEMISKVAAASSAWSGQTKA